MKKSFIALSALVAMPSYADWQPTKAIEIVVPFAPGGASDQMARVIQAAIQKNNLTNQPIIVTNKAAAAGGEAMLDMKKSEGDAHKLITTSAGIYMTPMATKLPVNWKDFTPVAMLAQDEFLLWTYTDAPYKNIKDFLAAVKKGDPVKSGGNGSKREDHLLSYALEQLGGGKITYIPYAGGGPTSVQLAGKHIDLSTGNPSEEIGSWKAGTARPFCVLSERRMAYTAPIAGTVAWKDIPTCKEEGVNLSYNMLRGMFMPGKVSKDQQAFYVTMFKKVTETPEWKEYLERNALLPDFRSGDDFVKFLVADEAKHQKLMDEAGFTAK